MFRDIRRRMTTRDWLFYALMVAAIAPATYHIVNNRAVNGILIIIFGIGLGSVVRFLMIMDPDRDPVDDDDLDYYR
ncbi:MAG TPA: hypothetical protein VKZ96_11055 [Thermomicrobiales bacterium]|nr:hypothetical protein [Thermomicrobiales bacterium]